MRRCLAVVVGILGAAFTATPAFAMGFAIAPPQVPLRERIAREKAAVVLGILSNYCPVRDVNNEPTDEATIDVKIERVLTSTLFPGGRKEYRIRAPSSREEFAKPRRCFLLCDWSNGRPDFYAGRLDPRGELFAYVRGALRLKKNDSLAVVRYFYGRLEDTNTEIAADAAQELEGLGEDDLVRAAPGLPGDEIARRLGNPRLTPRQVACYARLLGYCGSKKHGALLERLIVKHGKEGDAGELWFAYLRVCPTEGWPKLRAVLGDGARNCRERLCTFQALRLLATQKNAPVIKKNLAEAVCLLLEQEDMADLAIDQFRRWKQWDLADRVLALRGSKVHEVPVVRRALLRFALSCPCNEEADAYVAKWRKEDPKNAAAVEECLKLEREAMADTPASK